jgi:AcrR family transcriptional regulator
MISSRGALHPYRSLVSDVDDRLQKRNAYPKKETAPLDFSPGSDYTFFISNARYKNTSREKSMPKLVDHVSYRKQLLAQCFDLFAERGYSALTTRQIAEALNVSTGTLYHYFPTKEALFQQLVEEITQQTIIEALSQPHAHASLEERLFDLFRFLAEHEENLQKQFLITLDYYQHRALYGSSTRAILQSRADLYEQAIREYLGLPDSNLCSPLFSQINGLLTMRMLRSTTLSLVEQARPFIEMFAQAMQNASGETKER